MIHYQSNLPYPSFSNLEPNHELSLLMLSNLGGLHSKMNSCSLYFYNSIILSKLDVKLKEIMENICKVELYHLKLFAELSYYLGADPRFWECHDDMLEYWSPGFNIYSNSIKKILENAIIQEQNNISIYTHQLSLIDNPILCNVLKRIIADEQIHVDILQNYLYDYLK